ncbi:MAG TPA: arginine--tRNA ligase [Candidatus Atopostipes pullistercoris]|uniref:Arginine--tRNA ligase n=1 Tax=Candidatus Atopostipes pullistercoris TaxID=2838467 RepID=A0A9D2JXX1_9LACT|nr:arginine--tRNA ligase [Candidatus Atopostipes pullistercoris]
MDYKKIIAEDLSTQLSDHLTTDKIYHLLEKPKIEEHGDLAFPTFQLAKVFRKNPAEIAENLAENFSSEAVSSVKAVGPYLNFYLDKGKVSAEVLGEILSKKENYGKSDIGNKRNIPLDMSSPNIAKPMSMGHLRSTVIGNALANIVEKLGYNPVKINYLGDWGTQFGRLITAYKLWGDEEKVRANPIAELNELYVRFHEELEEDPELESVGRQWFRKLEAGDEEAVQLWRWFRKESLNEFNAIYDRLGITFDSMDGEAFFNDKMDEVIDILTEKELLIEDQGAQVVRLDEYDLQPALIKKQDGATLYITRDIAAALYRKRTYDFDEALYVVGQDQIYHFNQLKAVLNKMGYEWEEDIHHIIFGLISIDGAKMSTRRGKVVLLEDVLNEAVERALLLINEKNPTLSNKEEVAEQVGVGAVLFHDLQHDRRNDFNFNLDEIVQFEGETGPYVQYTRARALSILKKANVDATDFIDDTPYSLTDQYSWSIIKLIQSFSDTLTRAHREFEPSIIAKHALSVAQAFNRFYANVRVLDDHPEKDSRLALVYSVALMLEEDLRILGIQAPDEM